MVAFLEMPASSSLNRWFAVPLLHREESYLTLVGKNCSVGSRRALLGIA